MTSYIDTQLVKMMTPESAQQVMTELEKHFDSDSKLQILSYDIDYEQNSIKFVIRHIIPGEESPGYRVYHEHLYSLVHKNNSWEMKLLKSEGYPVTI